MNIKDFSTHTNAELADLRLEVTEQTDCRVVLKFTVGFAEKSVPDPVKVSFSRFIAPDWDPSRAASKTSIGSPMFSLINDDGSNGYLFGRIPKISR